MFCVTFYSFKGGVGRTLALANCAVQLAKNGKKVLVVDFDLEAPGLGTMKPFSDASDREGLVDFIHAYLDTEAVPDVSSYIHACVLQEEHFDDETGDILHSEHAVDFMPAGAETAYAERFSAIDWTELYAERDGFLLMETLRERWKNAGYDYVLIDSRTGHTDVGGICTRQLPDAVVALFFPNEQNLIGLEKVIEDIRRHGARPKPIETIFVASRVPRLDDERGELARWLRRFKSELDYDNDHFRRIDQYDSLRLLDQELFVSSRPNSSLGQQYRDLAEAIAIFNDEDPEGAFRFANDVARKQSTIIGRPNAEIAIIDRLDGMRQLHVGDTHVQFAIARALYGLRSLTSAVDAAEAALQAENHTTVSVRTPEYLRASIHRLRLKALIELDRVPEALVSAESILADKHATITTIIDAVLAICAQPKATIGTASDYPAILSAPPESQLRLLNELSDLPRARRLTTDLAIRLVSHPDLEDLDPRHNLIELQLQLISDQQFSLALKVPSKRNDPVSTLPFDFNNAMAMWGVNGEPDRDVYSELSARIKEMETGTDPNMPQCLALCYAVTGKQKECADALAEARRLLRISQQRQFSCWSYQKVTVPDFEEHLDRIQEFAKNGTPIPSILTRHTAQP